MNPALSRHGTSHSCEIKEPNLYTHIKIIVFLEGMPIMPRMLLFSFVLATSSILATATVYKSGGKSVDVTVHYVDNGKSNEKCVKYTSGAPTSYDNACFLTHYTEGGTFDSCNVTFGIACSAQACNSCGACQTDTGTAGYRIDCINIQPSKSTQSCIALNDTNIQQVLVGTDFASESFDFTDNSTNINCQGSGGGSSGTNGTTRTSGVASACATPYTIIALTAAFVSVTSLIDGF